MTRTCASNAALGVMGSWAPGHKGDKNASNHAEVAKGLQPDMAIQSKATSQHSNATLEACRDKPVARKRSASDTPRCKEAACKEKRPNKAIPVTSVNGAHEKEAEPLRHVPVAPLTRPAKRRYKEIVTIIKPE